MVWDGTEYYMYATTFGVKGFRYYHSDNLEEWTDGGLALDMSDSWAEGSFWAPEVVCRPSDKKYVMHFTARRESDHSLRIGVAVADKPQGPYQELKKEPMFDFGYAAIDGHVFIDDNGQAYLYYSRDCCENIVNGGHASQIYVVKLNEDLTEVVGEASLMTTPTYPFECDGDGSWLWNEGPAVLKRDGKYHLFYSANYYASRKYCVCVAISDTPEGPFVKSETENPILHADMQAEDFSGPGHNSFFFDKDGKLKTAFHIHTDEKKPGENRRACIADVIYENDGYRFEL